MTIPTNSFWYRLLFPNRYRIIRCYLNITHKREQDWCPNVTFGRGLHDNGLMILLSLGVTHLTERAFNDVCRRIIDEIKEVVIAVEPMEGFKYIVQHVRTYQVNSYKDPNSLYPMLPDADLYKFLKHCEKNNLTILPLSAASWEASAFVLGLPCANDQAVE